MKNQLNKWFTLIELIVVLSIITILGTMLITALHRVKDTAEKKLCANNMKQQYVGFGLYSNDHNGLMPKSPLSPEALALLSHRTESSKTYLTYANDYLMIETKPNGVVDERVDTAMDDVLSCPGVDEHIPESVYPHWKTMVEYTVMLGRTGSPGLRMMNLAAGPLGPKMLVSDRYFYKAGSTHPYLEKYLQSHGRREGGNVLSGDGSVAWSSDDAYANWVWYSGEGLSLPVHEYYVYYGTPSWDINNVGWFSPPNGTFFTTYYGDDCPFF